MHCLSKFFNSDSEQMDDPSKKENSEDQSKKENTNDSNSPQLKDNSHQHFDAVVIEERKRRQLTFGPNSVKVVKPSNVLIDIYGVICSWQFAKTLKEYANTNMGKYLKDNWGEKLVKEVVATIRTQLKTDRQAGSPVPDIANDDAPVSEQIETTLTSVLWQMEKKHKSTAVCTHSIFAATLLPNLFF